MGVAAIRENEHRWSRIDYNDSIIRHAGHFADQRVERLLGHVLEHIDVEQKIEAAGGFGAVSWDGRIVTHALRATCSAQFVNQDALATSEIDDAGRIQVVYMGQ